MSCPVCRKRKPSRFCPAKGEKICAICCGTEREVTIDCPSDCPYLRAARRYELDHRKPVPHDQLPYPDVAFSPQLLEERRDLLAGLGYTILKFAEEHKALDDSGAFVAMNALAETYRTLDTGIYYERAPDAPLALGLYEKLSQFLKGFQEEATRTRMDRVKESEVFRLLVFLLRVGRHETNGRPRSRAFLDFLRIQFPRAAESKEEASRIIVP